MKKSLHVDLRPKEVIEKEEEDARIAAEIKEELDTPGALDCSDIAGSIPDYEDEEDDLSPDDRVPEELLADARIMEIEGNVPLLREIEVSLTPSLAAPVTDDAPKPQGELTYRDRTEEPK